MKRVRCAQAFLKLNFELGLGFLDKIVTMDETSVSFFTLSPNEGHLNGSRRAPTRS
ncbi:Hypothetical protein FKW44_014528 [Caligus rogercresseyi]|uniref:Uncharacterized protein n=1 Tax=Caligus rogercresseyi TaxID=217165 RepID=A0A7T8K0H7_CALRO|nr:Hypothetical protein FKW44_014528 [Caligus rogercresseyi]